MKAGYMITNLSEDFGFNDLVNAIVDSKNYAHWGGDKYSDNITGCSFQVIDGRHSDGEVIISGEKSAVLKTEEGLSELVRGITLK